MELDFDLLHKARSCHGSLSTFRAARQRCKRFTYGNQWDDLIEDHGVRMRESDFIIRQGNLPLKNNLIRRLVRNVLGVYRNRWSEPKCDNISVPAQEQLKLNRLLSRNMQENRLEELYARSMEEFLISGLVAHKKWFGIRQGYSSCHTDLVQAEKFFFDTSARDFRGGDLTLIGEIHEITFEELAATFARTPDEFDQLCAIYGADRDNASNLYCTVYEVWERRRPLRLYCHDRLNASMMICDSIKPVIIENRRRGKAGLPLIVTTRRVEEEWRVSFLSPDAHVLSRRSSPYSHKSHPYVFKAYPFIDGEIHSFVNDIIDQQKLTNRLISMYDWILRASAKGVLLFPEGSLPDGVDINDIADEWGRFNGVIIYRPRPGVPVPQQVSSKSADIGITELLEIQMKMMEDISGVNGALQGKIETGTMSGVLYDQQTKNSMTALTDLLKTFDDFVAEATRIDISNLKQFTLHHSI